MLVLPLGAPGFCPSTVTCSRAAPGLNRWCHQDIASTCAAWVQVIRKADLVRKNMVQSVRNERNILAQANNPFVVPAPPSLLCMPECAGAAAGSMLGMPSQAQCVFLPSAVAGINSRQHAARAVPLMQLSRQAGTCSHTCVPC